MNKKIFIHKNIAHNSKIKRRLLFRLAHEGLRNDTLSYKMWYAFSYEKKLMLELILVPTKVFSIW